MYVTNFSVYYFLSFPPLYIYYSYEYLKGPAQSKNENLYFLAPAQTKLMQQILVSCEAPFRSNLKKKNIGPVGVILVQWGSWPHWTSGFL